MKAALWLLPAMLFLGALQAQPIYVYSEFATVTLQGKVTAPPRPREILSPAIARNGFSSFQVVIEAKAGEPWWFHIGQNPENAVTVTLYRQKESGLEEAELPIKGQGTQVFWMDIWAASKAPTGRIKVEPQLNIDNDWVIYPMEVRVSDPVVPATRAPVGSEPPFEVMRRYLCRPGQAGVAGSAQAPRTVAEMRFRNAMQDLSLATQSSKPDLQKLFGPCDAPAPANPEAYYAIRDFLVKHALH